jgi:hypothetical protein
VHRTAARLGVELVALLAEQRVEADQRVQHQSGGDVLDDRTAFVRGEPGVERHRDTTGGHARPHRREQLDAVGQAHHDPVALGDPTTAQSRRDRGGEVP